MMVVGMFHLYLGMGLQDIKRSSENRNPILFSDDPLLFQIRLISDDDRADRERGRVRFLLQSHRARCQLSL